MVGAEAGEGESLCNLVGAVAFESLCNLCLLRCQLIIIIQWSGHSQLTHDITALHCTALHCTTLHFTALHCNAI